MDLNGKIALITGAANGMGTAAARSFAALGATVLGVDVADDRGQELFAELGHQHRYIHLDVSDAGAWETALADVDRLDVAFLNAGVMSRPAGAAILDDPLTWLRPDVFRKVIGTNLDGVAFGLAAVIPLLDSGGDIVVTSSAAGVQPYAPDPAYASSKWALVGLCRSLAPSLHERGISLNVICPHSILTGMVPPDLRALPGNRFSSAQYIADSVLRILRSGETGRVWIARAENEPAWTVDFKNPMEEPEHTLD